MVTEKTEQEKIGQENLPDIIGLDGLITKFGVSQNTIYSRHRRGAYGTPDKVVSGTPIWWADRFAGLEIDLGPRPPLPVLLGPLEVAEAFDVKRTTIAIWQRRTRDRDVKTPEPALVISHTPIWLPEQWLPFAKATGRPYNPPKPPKPVKAKARKGK